MITVEIEKSNGEIKSIIAKGHADSDVRGKDIVCSAVSAVIVGGINALDNPKDFNLVVEEGLSKIIAKKEISSHDQIVLKTVVVQLRSIGESNYSKYIKIIEKGN